MGAASLNYLQIYGPDIEYANQQPPKQVTVTENGVMVHDVSAGCSTLASVIYRRAHRSILAWALNCESS